MQKNARVIYNTVEVGSAGVFRPSTREFSLPWQGEGKNLDTMQHEITHQMMQRILPVMPWWIAEGTAEYISIMKYQNGYFACNVVSKRQVTPELEKCAQIVNARGGAANPFESAMTYRGETNAEAVMDEYLADIERRLKAIEEHFKPGKAGHVCENVGSGSRTIVCG